MPVHDFICKNQHITDSFVEHGVECISCKECGDFAYKTFLKFPMSFVRPDICYESPIDGRHITSMAARQEDLARSNCVPYDPDIRQDYDLKIYEDEKRLEKCIEETIDKEIALMSPSKRDKLAGELEGGMTVEPIRQTASYKPITTEIK